MNKAILLIVTGTILRVLFILHLSTNQSIMSQKLAGTDIDYKIYTDASLLDNPYHRHTYRYTPLLAYMMTFNSSLEYAGKLIFVIFDIIAMLALFVLSKKQYRNVIVGLYAINPLFIYLTVRGSCESVACAMMLWWYWFGFEGDGNSIFEEKGAKKVVISDGRKYAWVSYVIYGLWVHFRVYPIIFLPMILVHQYKICTALKTSFINKFIQISVLSGGVFLALFAYFYHKYGYIFFQETYLYHLTRLDNRHSFSPTFYQIYLSLNTQSFIRSISQFCIVFITTKRLHKTISPAYTLFLITYAFVSFNKVITMQYYMWVWTALILLLPESTLLTTSNRSIQKSFSYFMQWLLGILLWVWSSIKLEKDGENVFNLMWLICVGKMGLDLWAVWGFLGTVVRNKGGYVQVPGKDKLEALKEANKMKNKLKV